MGQLFKNYKILFIGPVFFDYHTLIIEKLKDMGGDVTFYSEKKDGLLFGLLNNLNPKLINIYQKIYYYWILKKIDSERFTHFFLIRGYKIPEFFLAKLKHLNPSVKFILYQWDSNYNNPYFHILKYFDKASSFDLKDCNEKEGLKFLQLFYTDDIAEIKFSEKIKYNFFCFSSFTLDRYRQTIKVINYCKLHNYSFQAFCFIPISTYLRLKYFRGINLKEKFLSFKPMKREEYLKELSECETVVDLSHSTQTGLSMRIIEIYGAGKKVLTTNTSIINNPIYSTDWVQVIDIDDLKNIVFTQGNKLDRNQFLLDNWLKELFK